MWHSVARVVDKGISGRCGTMDAPGNAFVPAHRGAQEWSPVIARTTFATPAAVERADQHACERSGVGAGAHAQDVRCSAHK